MCTGSPCHETVSFHCLIYHSLVEMKHAGIVALLPRGSRSEQDLVGRTDLTKSDAFGRNALYYGCLCGHLDAVHFIVQSTVGSVKVSPEVPATYHRRR